MSARLKRTECEHDEKYARIERALEEFEYFQKNVAFEFRQLHRDIGEMYNDIRSVRTDIREARSDIRELRSGIREICNEIRQSRFRAVMNGSSPALPDTESRTDHADGVNPLSDFAAGYYERKAARRAKSD